MTQIENLKAKIDIVDLIADYLPLKKAGRNFKANCPFHQEKTPSFVVSPELQIFKCFGCGESGDAIKFLQTYERLDFWEAAEELAKRAGIKLTRKGRGMGKEEALKRQLYSLNNSARDLYHFLLTKHALGKKALDYALSRGLAPATLEKFKIGFSPLDPGASGRFLMKKRGFGAEELKKSGLVFQSQYGSGSSSGLMDRFHGRLIFPLLDHRGNVVSFAGRLIPGLLPNEDKRGKYINGPETIIYHKSHNLYGLWLTKNEIKKNDTAVLVEGELDMISSWQAGVKNVVASKGTALTIDQIKLIGRFATKLKLALDADIAGNQAVFKGLVLAEKEGLELSVATLPKGFGDPDDLARKDPKGLKKMIKKAIPVWDFVIRSSVEKYGTADPIAKKKVLAETLPLLAKIENEVVKQDYYKRLAQALGADLDSVLIEASKLKPSPAGQSRGPSEKKEEKDRESLLEEYLLALILLEGKPEKLLDLKFNRFALKRVWEELGKFLKKKKSFQLVKFLHFLPEELKPQLEMAFLKYGDKKIDDVEKEIDKAKQALEKIRLEKRLKKLSERIAREESRRKSKTVDRLREKFTRLQQKLFALSGSR